jgi:hypothetical protein
VSSSLPGGSTRRGRLAADPHRARRNATTDTAELAHFLTEAAALEKTQAALQVGVEATWKFLDTAADEGLAQAKDIYLQFRGGGRGKRGGPKLGSKGRPKKAKKDEKKKGDLCRASMIACLENPWQPEWNRVRFGMRKDCGACYRECRHAGGRWPHYKCPSP